MQIDFCYTYTGDEDRLDGKTSDKVEERQDQFGTCLIQVKVWPEQHGHRPRPRNIVGGGLPEVISRTIGSSHPHHPHGGPHPTATGGKMIAVVAVTGEDMTGGVSADGEHYARREPLPVEKRTKSTGDMAVIVHSVFPHRTAGAVAVMTVSVMHRGTGCLKPTANSFELKSMNLALNPCNQKRTFFCRALSPRGSVCLDGFVPAF